VPERSRFPVVRPEPYWQLLPAEAQGSYAFGSYFQRRIRAYTMRIFYNDSPTCVSGGHYNHITGSYNDYTPVCGKLAKWKHYPKDAVEGHFNYHCEIHGDAMKAYSDTENYTGKFELV
jgi:hypothetical protein